MHSCARVICSCDLDEILQNPKGLRRTELIGMRVELKYFPFFARKLDLIIIIESRTPTDRPRTRARSQSAPVAPGYELKVGEDVMLCEETEFDLIAGDVEEGGVGL